MGSADGGLGQVGPGLDEFADAAADERAGFGIDEQAPGSALMNSLGTSVSVNHLL
jgi:hypothetical protein